MNWQNKFNVYHAENPHVYALFLKYAREVKSKGYDRFSAKAIFERLRWHLNFETKSNDTFKLNNSYTAYYARKAMDENKDLDSFFQLREKSTD